MLKNAGNRETDFTATAAALPCESKSLLKRRIWLPKLLYDGLPVFYMFAGLSALATTIYISAWYWILPHYVLFSATCLHLCVAVISRRRTASDDGMQGSFGRVPDAQLSNQPGNQA